MSNDQALVQVNIKSGEGYDATLVNVYAKTPQELVSLLEAVKEHAPLIAEAKGAVAIAHGIEVKKGSVVSQQEPPAQTYQQAPQEPQQSGWGAPQQSGPPQWSQPASTAPSCRHGEMEWKDFTSKAGNHVKGHFCRSTNRQDSCPPQYKK